MGRPPPEDGDGLNPAAPEGLAVFHAQNIVGPGQQRRVPADAVSGGLGGEMEAPVQGHTGVASVCQLPENLRRTAAQLR